MTKSQKICDLIAQGQNEKVEFRAKPKKPKDLSRLIGALSNTSGGTILVGIEESGEIIGTDIKKARRLYVDALEKLEPKPRTSFEIVNIEGKDVAVITVEEADSLVLADSSAYAQVGSSVEPMTASDISRVLVQALADQPNQIEVLSRAIAEQSRMIEELDAALAKERSWQSKVMEYVVGAVVGAILSYLFSLFG